MGKRRGIKRHRIRSVHYRISVDLEDLWRLARARLALNLETSGKREGDPPTHQSGHQSLCSDTRTGAVAEQSNQGVQAIRLVRSSQVGLMSDPLVVDAQNVAQVGPPLD